MVFVILSVIFNLHGSSKKVTKINNMTFASNKNPESFGICSLIGIQRAVSMKNLG